VRYYPSYPFACQACKSERICSLKNFEFGLQMFSGEQCVGDGLSRVFTSMLSRKLVI